MMDEIKHHNTSPWMNDVKKPTISIRSLNIFKGITWIEVKSFSITKTDINRASLGLAVQVSSQIPGDIESRPP
jgi:hypothetical protein